MKALIVEDETAAATNLRAMLAETDLSVEVVGVLDTVVDTIHWLKNNTLPDLIFMDIHLSDGQAFKIFEQVDVLVPIVFTTAYDRYALEAFKVNSIDYLLKPIKADDLQRALGKFLRFSGRELADYVGRVQKLPEKMTTLQTFLIPYRDKLVPLGLDDIAYCYTSDEKVTVCTHEDMQLPLDKSLDTLMGMLPPTDFFRANRQFIVSRKAVKDMSVWFGHRLSINLRIQVPERIIVSKARVPEFKKWFMGI